MKTLILTFTLVSLLAGIAGCSDKKTVPASTANSAVSSVTELQKIDTVIGEGKAVRNNHRVAVHYTGWLYDENAADKKGKKFDSSYDRHRPFVFSLGNRDVIQGWEQGLLGMKEGGKRTLIIPPSMGYGSTGAGSAIPPNATLVFDIELLSAG